MSVVTAIEDAGPCLKKLTIEIPATAVEAETGRVVDEFSRKVRIPGFRPGKVPVAMVRKRFRQEIEKEIVDRLLPRYWKQAQAEKDIEPLIAPTVDDLKFEDGAPMVVTISVETRPEIALGDYQSFDLPREAAEPTDEDIDNQVDQLRKQQGRWLPVDREAARGDLVVADMKPIHDHHHDQEGHEPPTARPLFLEIGAPDADEELSLALTGQKAGHTFRHRQQHGEGEHAHSHEFDVTVREVKEQTLPEVNDEWAKQVGDFDTVGELRQMVGRRLRRAPGGRPPPAPRERPARPAARAPSAGHARRGGAPGDRTDDADLGRADRPAGRRPPAHGLGAALRRLPRAGREAGARPPAARRDRPQGRHPARRKRVRELPRGRRLGAEDQLAGPAPAARRRRPPRRHPRPDAARPDPVPPPGRKAVGRKTTGRKATPPANDLPGERPATTRLATACSLGSAGNQISGENATVRRERHTDRNRRTVC